jgi:phosphohistidine swiveling domain-containing protein
VEPPFPFEWSRPEHRNLYWFRDRMHFPHPCTPLSASIDAPAFSEGTTAGYRALGAPVRVHVSTPNGYWYLAPELDVPLDDLPRVREEAVGRMLPMLTRQLELWEQDYLPEVMRHNAAIRERDYRAMTVRQLAAHLDELRASRVRMWDLHMRAVGPVMAAAGQFVRVYEQVFGTDAGAYVLMQGFPNKSVESGAKLWDLSRLAGERPSVRETILGLPPARALAQLESTEGGRAFLEAFRAYLDEYGWRSDAFELADPVWIESPVIPLTLLREYLGRGDDANPAVREERARAERERLEREIALQIAGHPLEGMFRFLQQAAQQYVPIQENHNFYIDQMHTALLRRPLVEAGRRLAAAGSVATPDDVFFLTADELQDALLTPGRDRRAVIAERRAARDAGFALDPPETLGAPPPEPLLREPMLAAFYGQARRGPSTARVLVGVPASPGRVTATARVVRSLAEAGKLEPGDALVCEMTMPPWTPLFSSVSAVVADTGGVLSHCAIVAREYGVPCVVGVGNGTRVLCDGQRITVDGAAGTVTVEE